MDLYWLAKSFQSKSLYDNYKTQRKEYHRLLRRTKGEFYGELISNAVNKPKQIWDIVNEITDRHKDGNHIVLGCEIADPYAVAEIFGDYFSTVTGRAFHDVFGSNMSEKCTSSSFHNESTFVYWPVGEAEVINLIQN
ncbi:hypothetical protein HHI36_009092 [Cryptolaemus montrouzieri]|uniref:Uncharacterized protein n=1 Tax=Cryptolaemus montrouzieri TaxID=559131 RepID=A0ABD2MUE5_9CUCU